MLLRLELVTKYECSKAGAIPVVVVLSWGRVYRNLSLPLPVHLEGPSYGSYHSWQALFASSLQSLDAHYQ